MAPTSAAAEYEFDPADVAALAADLDRGDRATTLRLVRISLLDVIPVAGRA